MRILFDQGTPVPLRAHLAKHEVATVAEMGWSTLSNGELLDAAETQFDLLITTDQALRTQQNLFERKLAILVLPFASWPKLEPNAHQGTPAPRYAVNIRAASRLSHRFQRESPFLSEPGKSQHMPFQFTRISFGFP